MPTIEQQLTEPISISNDFDSVIYKNALKSRGNYYFKDSWLRPLALTDRINKQDNYYICMLGSEKFDDAASEPTIGKVILNGGIINPLTNKNTFPYLQS